MISPLILGIGTTVISPLILGIGIGTIAGIGVAYYKSTIERIVVKSSINKSSESASEPVKWTKSHNSFLFKQQPITLKQVIDQLAIIHEARITKLKESKHTNITTVQWL